MKKQYLTLLLLATTSVLCAQQNDYNPFQSSDTYQYLNASMDTVSSLRVIKAVKLGSDSIFTFNSVYFASSGFDSSNVFGQKMIQKTNGDYLFAWKEKDKYLDTMLLKTHVEIGNQWPLCNTCKTIAKYEGKLVYKFLSIQDTVMKITTDRGFEILISKKYGMVKTIDFKKYLKYRFVKPLFIDAIPEAGLGRFANDPLVIFDFGVGDVFVRKELQSNSWALTYNTRYVRYKVVEKIMSSSLDSVTYVFEVDSKSIERKYVEASSGNYSEKAESKFGDRETIVYGKYYKSEKKSVEKESFILLSQEYKAAIFNRYILFDSLTNRYFLSNGVFSFNFNFNNIWANYKSDIGLTDAESCRYSEPTLGQCIIAESSKLLCYTKANERLNDCSIYDEIITSSELREENNQLLKLFPNPTTGLVTIGNGQIDSFANIQILNTLGMVVLEEKFTNTINMEALPTGVYWLRTQDLQGRLLQAKVVKK